MYTKNFDPYDFEKKDINGVPVYWKNLPWAPCVHIRIVVNAGTFNDPVGKEGVAHFLEHLVGNGCPSLPDKKSIKEFSRLYMLNSRNAYTSHYRTVHTGKCLLEHLPKVLEGMKDYIFHSFLRSEDVEHERKVITQEAWGRYKNEKFLKYVKEFSKNIFSEHQRSRITSSLGWPETVQIISQKDVADFYTQNYIKENISIVLTGAINENDIVLLHEFTNDIPSGSETKILYGNVSKPLQSRFTKTGEEIGDPKEQLEFSILREAEKMTEKEEATSIQARMLLYDILYERLRLENSLCYGVSFGWHEYRDYQEVGISVKTSEEKMPIVEKEIWNIIAEVIEGKWRSRFDNIHALAIDQFKSKEHSSEEITEIVVNDLTINRKITTLKETLEKAEKVNHTDVQDLIKKTFDPEWVFTEVILPTKR